MMRSLFIYIFIAVSLAARAGDMEILVATDIHVMSPGLVVSDGKAWQDYLESDTKLQEYSVSIFTELVNTILARKPDVVLIPGDLTKDGEKESHEYVVSRLSLLKEAGIKVFVIPGNHDVDGDAVCFDGDNTRSVDNVSAGDFAAMYSGYGYGSSLRDGSSLSYMASLSDDVVLMAIDSHTGSLSDETLTWVCERAAEARSEGKQIIAMMHHPLMEHFNGQNTTRSSAILGNADDVRSKMLGAGIKVVFTGHFHYSDISLDYNSEHTDSVYDISTGAQVTYPMHYRVATVAGDNSTLKIQTYAIESIEGYSDFQSVAKSRLETVVRNMATANGYGSYADLMTQAFVLHAQGNERLSGGEQLLQQIPGVVFTIFPAIKTTLTSMLTDVSQYGTANANQTDDLTLDIKLSDVKSGITSVAAPVMSEAIYNLLGQKVGEECEGLVIRNGKLILRKGK